MSKETESLLMQMGVEVPRVFSQIMGEVIEKYHKHCTDPNFGGGKNGSGFKPAKMTFYSTHGSEPTPPENAHRSKNTLVDGRPQPIMATHQT